MQSLSSTLSLAQKETSREALWKLVLSKTGEDTLTYEADRITYLQHRGGESSQSAQVLLDNSDHELRDTGLEGYQGDIYIGCVTPLGDEFGQEAPLWVITQQLYSLRTGELLCVLNLGGMMNLLNLDKASAAYEPDSGDARTVKDWLTEILELIDTSSESTEEQTTVDSDMALDADKSGIGQKVTISDRTVTDLSFRIRRVGNPHGDVYFVVRRTSDEEILAYKFQGDAFDLSTSYSWVKVTFDTPLQINDEVKIYCEFTSGSASNYVDVKYNASSVKAGENLIWLNSSWTEEASYDVAYKYTYSATPITGYSHCTPIAIVWDSEDSLIDTYQPQDRFLINKRQTRKDVVEQLLGWTDCVGRPENDGKFHIFVPKKDTSTIWVASTAYSLRDLRIPTTANGYVYICTTAGTTGSSEPTWKTGIGDTITDGTVVWTVAYDYEFELPANTAAKHAFYDKTYNRRLIMPAKITVESRTTDDDQYSGSAQTSDYSSRKAILQKQDFLEMKLASNAQGTSIAEAMIAKLERDAETGSASVPMNVGSEVFDFVNFVDDREGVSRNGVIREITKTCKAGDEPQFDMQIRFGLIAPDVQLGLSPTSTMPPRESMEMNWILLQDHMKLLGTGIDINWNEIKINDDRLDSIEASLTNWDINFASVAETSAGVALRKSVSPNSLAVSIYGARYLSFSLNGKVALTTDDKAYQRIPNDMDGWKLIKAEAMVKDGSSSGGVTLTVKNGVTSMLSTDITIDVNETDTLTAAAPPVVDAAEDDVAVGDQIEVAVSGAGTGVTYCVALLTFTKDV